MLPSKEWNVLAALVLDPDARRRVSEATRGHANTRFYECGGELIRALATSRQAIVVLELGSRHGRSNVQVLHTLRARFPAVPVVAYCLLTPTTSEDILDASRVGVNALVLRVYDDLGVRLQTALEAARNDSIAARTLSTIGPLVPKLVWPVLQYCIRNVQAELTASCVASALGISRKTLDRRLVRSLMPTAMRLIGWSRLLVSGHLLEKEECRADWIALEVGFEAGSPFRNMLKRYTGLTPSEVRQRGGFPCVLSAFENALVYGRGLGIPMRRKQIGRLLIAVGD